MLYPVAAAVVDTRRAPPRSGEGRRTRGGHRSSIERPQLERQTVSPGVNLGSLILDPSAESARDGMLIGER